MLRGPAIRLSVVTTPGSGRRKRSGSCTLRRRVGGTTRVSPVRVFRCCRAKMSEYSASTVGRCRATDRRAQPALPGGRASPARRVGSCPPLRHHGESSTRGALEMALSALHRPIALASAAVLGTAGLLVAFPRDAIGAVGLVTIAADDSATETLVESVDLEVDGAGAGEPGVLDQVESSATAGAPEEAPADIALT